jgi:hypothetical protein
MVAAERRAGSTPHRHRRACRPWVAPPNVPAMGRAAERAGQGLHRRCTFGIKGREKQRREAGRGLVPGDARSTSPLPAGRRDERSTRRRL